MWSNRSSQAAVCRAAAGLRLLRSRHPLHSRQRRIVHSSRSTVTSPSSHTAAIAVASAVVLSAATVGYWTTAGASADCAAGASTVPAAASSRTPPPPGIKETTTQRTTFIDQLVPLPPSQQTAQLPLQQLALLFTPPDIPNTQPTPPTAPPPSASLPAYPAYPYTASPPLVFTAGSADSHHQRIEGALRRVQDIICQHILNIEAAAPPAPYLPSHTQPTQPSPPPAQPASFREDVTQRADGGGIARVLSDGVVFQKAGVNSSFARVRLPFGRLRDMKDDHRQLAALIADNEWQRQQQQRSGGGGGGWWW